MQPASFQEAFAHIHCFGCGARNPEGLQIRSHWLEPGTQSECVFVPHAHHCAGPRACLNGGVLATVMDCHAVCTAMAEAYLSEGRPLDSLPPIQYATARLAVDYLRPARIDQSVRLEARIVSVAGRKTSLQVTAWSGDTQCASAEVLAVRVPGDWQP